jgi:hypothetical protein
MAKPKVFVSSTYYDLKHVRAALSEFIESLGFEPILHERGAVPYLPNVDLDESCRIELQTADIVVLIVGGRYGSPTSASIDTAASGFYESVTRSEFRTAADRHFPMWVMVEKSVWYDWENYNANRDQPAYKYAHTSDFQVFSFIDEIRSFRNKSIYQFEHGAEIVRWLRDQWAGVFAKLFRDAAETRRLGEIEAQVCRLEAVVKTLTDQLDYIMADTAGHGDVERVRRERSELTERRQLIESVQASNAILALRGVTELSLESLLDSLSAFENVDAVIKSYEGKLVLPPDQLGTFRRELEEALGVVKQLRLTPQPLRR